MRSIQYTAYSNIYSYILHIRSYLFCDIIDPGRSFSFLFFNLSLSFLFSLYKSLHITLYTAISLQANYIVLKHSSHPV